MNHTGTARRATAREQFDALLTDFESAWSVQCEADIRSAADEARGHVSETLNQGLRRLRNAKTIDEAAVTAVEITQPFAARCAAFQFHDGEATALAARGLGPLPLTFSPDAGAAFRTCIETQDPVTAMSSESEISRELAERVGSAEGERVYLLPVAVRQEVRAILFAAGAVQPAPLELIAGMAAMRMELLMPPPVTKRADLVEIGGASPAAAGKVDRQTSWADLSPELQALHLRAQREARLRVAEMRLEHGAALRKGLETGDLYTPLQQPIDAAREAFRKEYVAGSPTMVDYFYLEMVRALARDDDRLLGPHFPGPLV